MVRLHTDGTLLICTYSGLIRYRPEQDTGDILFPNMAVSDVLFDLEGTIWFSTLQSGLIIVPDAEFREWKVPGYTTASAGIRQLTFGEGSVFFASVDGCVRRLDLVSGTQHQYCLETQTDFSTLQYNPDNHNIWFATSNQIYILKNGQIRQVHGSIPPVKDLLFLQDAYLMATSFGLFVQPKSGSPSQRSLITSAWTRQLYQTASGEIFAATDEGIKNYMPGQPLASGWVLCNGLEGQVLGICGNVQGDSVFALAFDGHILRNTADGFVGLTQIPDGFAAQDIRYWNGCIWVATHAGLLTYQLQRAQWDLHRPGSGLAETDIHKIIFHENLIWLATNAGLRCIPVTPGNVTVNPVLYLRSLWIDTVQTSELIDIQISAGQSLTLVPEVAGYRLGNSFHYGYRILELDTNWISVPGTQEGIGIRAMPAGRFTLEMCVLSHSGLPIGNKIILTGYASPPFWQRWWFYLLLGIAAIALTSLIAWIRIRKERLRQKRDMNRLALENDVRLSRQTALTSQMNPHFLFNVLNSIKAYIYGNDRRLAVQYLDDFAILVRKTLDMSKVATVSLREEIEALRVYIGLEAMMLEGGLTWKINIGEHVDTGEIHIPPLLLQPFVENALKHGLRHLNGEKVLNISFELKNDRLVVTITDNGIGRVAATELNRNRHGHVPFSTGSALHRIDLLNASRTSSASLEITDLTDANGNASGTRVTITLVIT